MSNTTEHGVIGPDGECIFSGFCERFGISQHHLLAVFGSNTKFGGKGRVELPSSGSKIVYVDIGIR